MTLVAFACSYSTWPDSRSLSLGPSRPERAEHGNLFYANSLVSMSLGMRLSHYSDRQVMLLERNAVVCKSFLLPHLNPTIQPLPFRIACIAVSNCLCFATCNTMTMFSTRQTNASTPSGCSETKYTADHKHDRPTSISTADHKVDHSNAHLTTTGWTKLMPHETLRSVIRKTM